MVRILFPREHGAWVMFAAAFFLGVAAGPGAGPGFRLAPVAALAVAMFALFVVREPVSQYWRRQARAAGQRASVELGALRRQIAAWGAMAVITGAFLVLGLGEWRLLVLAAIATAIMGIYLLMRRRRLERTATAEFLGVAQLALVAPAAYLAAGGVVSGLAFELWVLTFLYCGASVPYVKLKVSQVRQRPESVTDKLRLGAASLAYQVLALAFAGAAALAGIIPAFALLGFGLNAAKVAAGVLSVPRERLNLKGIGWWETALTAAFVLLAAIGYEFGSG